MKRLAIHIANKCNKIISTHEFRSENTPLSPKAGYNQEIAFLISENVEFAKYISNNKTVKRTNNSSNLAYKLIIKVHNNYIDIKQYNNN